MIGFLMEDAWVLALVFAAASWITWVVTPLIAQIGFERGQSQYIQRPESQHDPLYRFTTPERLLQARWSAAVLAGGLVGAILLGFSVLNEYILVGTCLLAGLISYQVPKWWVNRKIQNRQLAFESRLMDLTLALANGLRSGGALPQCIEMITREMTGPMQEEFSFVLQEYRLGIDLPESLARLSRRMPGEDLYLLTTAVRLTMQSGGSLAEVLDRIADTIRNRTEFHQKLKTMTAQGRFEAIAMASAPIAAFLIILLVDKELMMPLITTQTGWIAIGIVAVLEIVGFIVINKIVTIKV